MQSKSIQKNTSAPARVAVLVSGGGTNLQALLDAQTAGELHSGQITLVIAGRAGVYALTRAEKAGIPSEVVARKDFPDQQAFEAQMVTLLEQYRIDLIVLAGYLSILSEAFTARYPKRIINIHPSLIPSFCGKDFYGLRVHEAALARGVKYTGATVHFVNEIPDGGEIIAQKVVEVLPGDTAEALQKRVMEQAEWKLLPSAVEQICSERRSL